MITLSVMIPTRNRSSLLRKLLESLKKQTCSQDEFEIIIVDNGSTDETKTVAETFFSEFKHIKYFFEEKPGLHEGRHRGLKESSSDILVYCDDDIEPLPTWLEAKKESFKDPDVVLVGGKNLPKWESVPPKWIKDWYEEGNSNGKCLGSLSILDFGDEFIEIDPNYIWGCNFSIRKQTLIDAGGFHPDSMPEELKFFRGDGESHVTRWIKEKGLKAVYNPQGSVFHFVPRSRMTLDYFKKRSFNQGISDSFSYMREKDKVLLKPVKREPFSLRQFIRYYYLMVFKDESFDYIQKCIQKSYFKGINEHFKKCKKDQKLSEWVMSEKWIHLGGNFERVL